jgi:hypothetical protein
VTTQPLPFVRVYKDKAARLSGAMLRVLADGRWHSAADLAVLVDDLDDRTCRAIAERSDGAILSSQSGYKLTEFATAAECRHAESVLQGQARKMLARAVEIRNARARASR